MYKFHQGFLKVFLVHPGGPFFKDKDLGWWSIPKGEVEEGENLLQTAIREIEEETGIIPKGPYIELGQIKQKAGKIVNCWAFEGDWSGLLICKSWVSLPARNGAYIKFPEVDKAGFFLVEEAKKKINQAQKELIERLESKLQIPSAL